MFTITARFCPLVRLTRKCDAPLEFPATSWWEQSESRIHDEQHRQLVDDSREASGCAINVSTRMSYFLAALWFAERRTEDATLAGFEYPLDCHGPDRVGNCVQIAEVGSANSLPPHGEPGVAPGHCRLLQLRLHPFSERSQ